MRIDWRSSPTTRQDEQNSLTQTQLLMKTGGGSAESGQGRGIHWHIENPVYYIATDEKRQDIPWVSGRVRRQGHRVPLHGQHTDAGRHRQGGEAEDGLRGLPQPRNPHLPEPGRNRSTRRWQPAAIPADLPYIKQHGAEVLGQKYATEEEAAAAIAGVAETLQDPASGCLRGPRRRMSETAVTGLQAIFDQNAFPFMNVDWQSHPDNIGHKNFPGCFRCHDGKHLSSDNQAIRLECNICHSIPAGGRSGPAFAADPASECRRTRHASQHDLAGRAPLQVRRDLRELPYGRQPRRQRQQQLLLEQRLPCHRMEIRRPERAQGARALGAAQGSFFGRGQSHPASNRPDHRLQDLPRPG